MIKKVISIVLSSLMVLALAGCGNSTENASLADSPENSSVPEAENIASADTSENEKNTSEEASPAVSDKEEGAGNHILVAYFSLAGEQYQVGVVEEGNTSVIAHMIAEDTGADLFAIEAADPYPDTYDGLLEVSRQEMADDARPEIAGTVENMEDYDTVFIGFPIWWGEMPMIVRGFLESYDLEGKTVVPFCTHGGSGLSGTEQTAAKLCTGADIADGFAISGETAQNDRETAHENVTKWLEDGGFLEYP